MFKKLTILLIGLMIAGCAKKQIKPIGNPVCDCTNLKTQTQKPQDLEKLAPVQLTKSSTADQPKVIEVSPNKNEPTVRIDTSKYPLLKPAAWQDLNGILEDNLDEAWPAWLQSCTTLVKRLQWQTVCVAAKQLHKPNSAAIIEYLTTHFNVYKTRNENGSDSGKITGYYQPLLNGSKNKSAKYPYPLYRQPEDLITVDLGEQYPELKFKRVRGQLVGNKLVPYRSRAEIDASPSPLVGTEIFWIDDIIDVFFLHIQGSGVVQLENSEQVQVGYENHNGHNYQSIGRLLIERGEISKHKASMQGIKNWARNNLDKLQELLNSNPSYVFFKELPSGLPGPLGALGVPITAQRSVAVDRKFIPLGAPIFLSTTQPNSNKLLKKLMLAQDTGGAIKGGVRADFFWGAGDAAGEKAGSMNQVGKIWVLLPKNFKLN